MGLLTFLIALPFVGALAITFVRRDDVRAIRAVAMTAAGAALAASLVLLARFEVGRAGFQLEERADWVPRWGISYHVGVDGISLFLVALTTLLTVLVFVAAWHQEDRAKGFFTAFLLLEGAVLGVFLAMDLVLFYVFWEGMLVPMYLIIGIWGYERRRYASVKFFLYTFLGGLVMLVGVVVLYAQTGGDGGAPSFDYLAVRDLQLDPGLQRWLFAAFFASFAVKVPLFPLHTWLPDAHTEAPTAGSVILAGVLLKLGAFGLLRYSLPLFPDATRDAVPLMLVLCVIGVIYGAIVALTQRDMKKLVAYSSISHMGFVVLGIFALTTTATSGGVIQMINHGLSTGALFLLVGFLYERRHTRRIADFGGLAKATPVYAGLFLVVVLSSLALPGLNGFVGEFPILLGTFTEHRWAAAAAASGMVLAAVYLLWMYQRVFHGPLEDDANARTPDLERREILVLAPLVALMVVIGVYPQPIFDRIEPTIDALVAEVRAEAGMAPEAGR